VQGFESILDQEELKTDSKVNSHRKTLTNSLRLPQMTRSDPAVPTNDNDNDNTQQPTSEINPNRRKVGGNNRSTYIERSLFNSAIDSLFGEKSIFSALDDPRKDEKQEINEKDDVGDLINKGRE